MRIIVTCGPGHEPIDRVRRITNLSTGMLGSILSDRLAEAGFDVLCMIGQGAMHAPSNPRVEMIQFETNDHLLELLLARSERERVDAVLHSAALPDFRVRQIRDADGNTLQANKISSRIGDIRLDLHPSLKIVSKLRDLFPRALIVGWKYETDGGSDEALARGRKLIADNRLDACVVNGPACGLSFLFCPRDGQPEAFRDRARLAPHVVRWLSSRLETAP